MCETLQAKRASSIKDENRLLKEKLGAQSRELKLCKKRWFEPQRRLIAAVRLITLRALVLVTVSAVSRPPLKSAAGLMLKRR